MVVFSHISFALHLFFVEIAIKDLDPDNGDHLLVCFGGEYATDTKDPGNMPFRGLDSSYSNRWCSNANEIRDADDKLMGYKPTSETCDHYSEQDRKQIPKMNVNVREAINFLGKDDDGFFMLYEQGDVSYACFGFVEAK